MTQKFNPIYHTAMVQNWRRIANIPENCTDEMIYNVVTNNDLHYSSGQSEEENNAMIEELRENLPIGSFYISPSTDGY